jgi:hypothetical protein
MARGQGAAALGDETGEGAGMFVVDRKLPPQFAASACSADGMRALPKTMTVERMPESFSSNSALLYSRAKRIGRSSSRLSRNSLSWFGRR